MNKVEYQNVQILAKRNNGREIGYLLGISPLGRFPDAAKSISRAELTELVQKLYKGGGTLELWIWNMLTHASSTKFYEPEIRYEWYWAGEGRNADYELVEFYVRSIWAKLPNLFKEKRK